MEEFLSSNGVQYEHHDVATDEVAREDLKSRDIKSLPVTIIDNSEIIIGYYPKKLIPALKLKISVDLSVKTDWLSEKYGLMLKATVRAARQLSDAQLGEQVPWREWTLRRTVLHVLSFPELALNSHTHGSMSTDDMRDSDELLSVLTSVDDLAKYGDGVREAIVRFLASGDTKSYDRVVPAHYGGEVTVLELLNIILSHSTHHLKQLYWHMETNMGITLLEPATEADLEGIATPSTLI